MDASPGAGQLPPQHAELRAAKTLVATTPGLVSVVPRKSATAELAHDEVDHSYEQHASLHQEFLAASRKRREEATRELNLLPVKLGDDYKDEEVRAAELRMQQHKEQQQAEREALRQWSPPSFPP